MDLPTLVSNTVSALLTQIYSVMPTIFGLLAVMLGIGLIMKLFMRVVGR